MEISLTGQYSPRHAPDPEELDSYNAITDPAVRDKSGDIVDLNIQPASYFLTSYYDNIRDLNLRNSSAISQAAVRLLRQNLRH